MWEEITRAIPVYFSSMVKFIFGPVGGYVARLNMITTIFTTIAGMMTVVIAFTFFGELIKRKIINRFFPRRKRFTERNRKFIIIWRKYGLAGVAALTPLLRDKLIIYMFVSASFWAVTLSLAIYLFGNSVIQYFK